eukprot:CAMPEP_0198678838 /NCGR_PEP_ID=MMETSP1468-20131203/1629_1 /TAXON_ID=1461545 /ORGANISM="Mantoniella sp, Strain CCMP1436" /LENGTH=33 /DNA_ID= /DNA_START= /DNA_END= /DNA_ORIENTATION=
MWRSSSMLHLVRTLPGPAAGWGGGGHVPRTHPV